MSEFVNEVWKHVDNFPLYEVSNCGRMRNSRTGRIRKLQTTRLGYMQVIITTPIKPVALSIHRLIAIAFLGEPVGIRNEVNHIDGNKQNNHVGNLEWVSRKENIAHAYQTGLKRTSKGERRTKVWGKSGTRGVSRVTNGKNWRSHITVNGKQIYLGSFKTIELATEAYQTAEKHYFPEGN